MGARGPLSNPRGLKIIKSGEDVEPESLADEVIPGAPDQPPGMGEAERDLWDLIVPKLDDLGLVCTVDGLTIDLALRHYLAAVEAADQLANADAVAVVDEKNKRLQKHPADAVFRLHSQMFLNYAEKLGMTFVSRARLAARGGSGDGEDNPFVPTQASGGS